MDSLNAGDFAEAFCIWRPLAMQGHVEAAYHLGWLYDMPMATDCESIYPKLPIGGGNQLIMATTTLCSH